MSRQIQLRRGTADEHNTFIGAPGEITVDTTANILRVHDGQTPGGTPMARADSVPDMGGADYVVAWQNPTAENNYTWFRRYKSGWVTQGGKLSGRSITFPIQFALLPTLTTCTVDADTNVVANNLISNIKTTGFDGFFQSANKDWIGPARDMNGYWMACGVTSE